MNLKHAVYLGMIGVAATSFAGEIPSFLQGVKMKTDLRVRYEGTDYDADGKKNRNRGRYRLRFSFDKKINDQLNAGFRLASGGGDATSTNQTFTDGFEGKGIWIDRAYVTYKNTIATIGAGKVANPFVSSNLIWDGDVNPEGLYEKFKVGKNGFITLAQFMVKENKSSHDVNLLAAQFGLKTKTWNLALAYYDYNDIEDAGLSLNGNNGYAEDFNLLDLIISYKWKISNTPISIKLNIIKNLGEDGEDGIESKDTGMAIFLKLGQAKSPGTWEVGLKYANIEANSVVGAFNDSDFGFADKKGFVMSYKYQSSKHISWKGTYFDIKSIDAIDKGFARIHFDCQLKF